MKRDPIDQKFMTSLLIEVRQVPTTDSLVEGILKMNFVVELTNYQCCRLNFLNLTLCYIAICCFYHKNFF